MPGGKETQPVSYILPLFNARSAKILFFLTTLVQKAIDTKTPGLSYGIPDCKMETLSTSVPKLKQLTPYSLCGTLSEIIKHLGFQNESLF